MHVLYLHFFFIFVSCRFQVSMSEWISCCVSVLVCVVLTSIYFPVLPLCVDLCLCFSTSTPSAFFHCIALRDPHTTITIHHFHHLLRISPASSIETSISTALHCVAPHDRLSLRRGFEREFGERMQKVREREIGEEDYPFHFISPNGVK